MADQPINPANQGMTFDAAPVTAPTPADGMTFDAAPVTQDTSASTAPKSDEITTNPTDSLLTKAGKTAGGFVEGIGEGVFGTAAGASDISDKVTGMQKGAANKYLHTLAGDDNASHGTAQLFGQGGETIAEFLLGDEALKGAVLSEKLLQTGRIAKLIEGSPRLAKALTIGINALRAGGVQGVDTLIKSGGDTGEATGQGLMAGGLTAGLGAAGATVKAIRGALDLNGIQQPLQDGIKSILSDAADKAGVNGPTATSIRDAAQQVSDGVKAQAQGAYKSLDNISGGQAQRFRDAAENVSSKLREIVGLDDEKEAELLKRQAEIDTAHKAMLDKLEAQGYDRNMLAQADATWKQQAALSDLSNAVRQSTSGLRPELANGVAGATTPESVNPKTLFIKINRLNDRGRLAQAIGKANADALLQHVDSAYVQAQKIAARNKFVGLAAKAAGAVGLGELGYRGLVGLHEMLGNNQ
jgi:hypothetical protein